MIQICLLTFFWDKAKNVWFRPFSLFFFKKWLKLQYDIQIGWNLCFTLNFILNFIEIKPVFRAHFHTVKWTESHIFGIIWEKSQLIDMLNHILALGLVSYNFCMIPLACAWNFGSTNLKHTVKVLFLSCYTLSLGFKLVVSYKSCMKPSPTLICGLVYLLPDFFPR